MTSPYREVPKAPPIPRKPKTYWHWGLPTDAQETVGFWLWMLYMLVAGCGVPYLFLRLGAVNRGFMPWWMVTYYGVFGVTTFLFPAVYCTLIALEKREYP